MSNRFLALFIASFFLTQIHSQDLSDSVVKIIAEFENGTWTQSTGFFISTNETIVTCYHGIHRAKRIKIIYNRRKYHNVTVYEVAPNYDLATLKIDQIISTGNPLQPNTSEEYSRTVDVVGYPLNMLEHRHRGFVTSSSTLKSTTIRDPNRKEIFNNAIDVIPVELTVYNGMSGSPIIDNGRVIGVLSGSIGVGGSISWGIPIKYLDNLTLVDSRPNDLSWPKFNLMNSNNWRALGKRSFLSKEFFDLNSSLSNQGDSHRMNLLRQNIRLNTYRVQLQRALTLLRNSRSTRDYSAITEIIDLADLEQFNQETLAFFQARQNYNEFIMTLSALHVEFTKMINEEKDEYSCIVLEESKDETSDLIFELTLKFTGLIGDFQLIQSDLDQCKILAGRFGRIKEATNKDLSTIWNLLEDYIEIASRLVNSYEELNEKDIEYNEIFKRILNLVVLSC